MLSQSFSGIKGNTEDEIDKKFSDLKGLMFLLNSRDSYLKTYTKLLSLRLLNGTSISIQAERQMHIIMESEWGHMAVNKIKSMLQDMDNSKELNANFHQHLTSTKVNLGYEFNI